jgi:hypothetical protein
MTLNRSFLWCCINDELHLTDIERDPRWGSEHPGLYSVTHKGSQGRKQPGLDRQPHITRNSVIRLLFLPSRLWLSFSCPNMVNGSLDITDEFQTVWWRKQRREASSFLVRLPGCLMNASIHFSLATFMGWWSLNLRAIHLLVSPPIP